MDDMKSTTSVYAASDAKNNFGKLLDAAQRRPVAIERHGRTVAYVISKEDMDAIEDHMLGVRAVEIMKTGSSSGVKKSQEFLDGILKKKTHE